MARALMPGARHSSHAPPAKRPPPLSAAEIQARVLHRDGLILVIDKPAGLAVHAGPSRAPNLEECFDALRFGLPRPPALAHRLDADTSGVLVLGRHPKALSKLGWRHRTSFPELVAEMVEADRLVMKNMGAKNGHEPKLYAAQ